MLFNCLIIGLKGFGVFLVPNDKEVKFINGQLVQLIVSDKTAVLDLTKVLDATNKKICVASIDINNNVSALKAIN